MERQRIPVMERAFSVGVFRKSFWVGNRRQPDPGDRNAALFSIHRRGLHSARTASAARDLRLCFTLLDGSLKKRQMFELDCTSCWATVYNCRGERSDLST